mgnify:CR=1 FL=1
MRNRAHTIKAIILGGAALGALAACSVDQPGHLNVNKPQVQIEDFSALEPVRALDSKALESMAKQYHRHGAGTMDVTVTYDPKSKTDTALRARREAARIAKTLQADGVRDVKTSILPVQDGDADLEFGDLSVEVPCHEPLAQQLDTMHFCLDAASAVVSTPSSPERAAEVS